MLTWLDELIDRTCSAPPVLVGQLMGGAIAARYPLDHAERLRMIVLVDTLGPASAPPLAGVRPHHGRFPGPAERGQP